MPSTISTPVSARAANEDLDALRRLAAEHGVTVSYLVARAVRQSLGARSR
jgi:hypothetical protein